MKKACIYYSTSFGRNDGSPLYYCNQLKKLKELQVTHSSPQGDTVKLNGPQDYHFWVDWGEDGLPVDHNWKIPKDGGKTIYIASDTHLGREYRFKMAQKFDYVFFNQKRAVDEYIAINPTNKDHVWWLPHAFEPKAYYQFNIMKKYDVCFIGFLQHETNYNGMNRVDALDRLFREFPNFYFGQMSPVDFSVNKFDDAAKKFCQSNIVFNISIKDDVNMRVFESLGTRSFLLTNNIPTLHELFENGKHLVMYDSYGDMIEKAKYYLLHDDEREKIAEAGYNEVIAKHTYAHRLRTVFETIK